MPKIASACLLVYTDHDVDLGEAELEAWAWVGDSYTIPPCNQYAYQWGYFEHSYEATVEIESPTQNLADDFGSQADVAYGGGSAEVLATISLIEDFGDYIINLYVFIWCTVGGDLLDDEYQVEVPIFPCDASGVDTVAIITMVLWNERAYERGGTIICVSNIALTAYPMDSFGDIWTGPYYTPTDDPCVLELKKTGAIGGYHSHPFFWNDQELNRENGCHGINNYNLSFSEIDAQINTPNVSFQGKDFDWPKAPAQGGTGTPFLFASSRSRQDKETGYKPQYEYGISTMNRLMRLPLIVLPIVGFTTPICQSQAQPLGCAVDDLQCLEDGATLACAPPDALLEPCLTWLRRLESDPSWQSPEWRLMAASVYSRAARLASSEEDAERVRERSDAIYREVLATWQYGYYANQAYVGLASLSDNIDEQVSLLGNALQADPDNGNTMYILASHLERRGLSGDWSQAADLYEAAYLASPGSPPWYFAANALRLYAAAGQPDRAESLRDKVATDSGMAEFSEAVTSEGFAQDLGRAASIFDIACHRYIIVIFGQNTCATGIDTLVGVTRSVVALTVRQAIADVATEAMSSLSVSASDTAEERSQREFEFGSILREWIDTGAATARVYVLWAQQPNTDLNEGIAAFERAVALAPDNGRYRYWLAQGYIARGHYDEAIEHLTLARDTLPEDGGLTPESVDREIRRAESARSSGQ